MFSILSFFCSFNLCWGDVLEDTIKNLNADHRELRDQAYTTLAGLADPLAKEALPKIKRALDTSQHPEVKLRCHSLLKNFFNRWNLPKRLGFLGISQESKQVEFAGKDWNVVGVVLVHRGSAADKAGLQQGDAIVEFNKENFSGVDLFELDKTFRSLVQVAGMNAEVDIDVIRNGELVKLKATLGKSPEDQRDFSEIEAMFPEWLESIDVEE